MSAEEILSKPSGLSTLPLYKIALILLVVLFLIGGEFDARFRILVQGTMVLSLLVACILDIREALHRRQLRKKLLHDD